MKFGRHNPILKMIHQNSSG